STMQNSTTAEGLKRILFGTIAIQDPIPDIFVNYKENIIFMTNNLEMNISDICDYIDDSDKLFIDLFQEVSLGDLMLDKLDEVDVSSIYLCFGWGYAK
ncbi:hypothetical protein ACJX0J_016659, partial [Zea mays]